MKWLQTETKGSIVLECYKLKLKVLASQILLSSLREKKPHWKKHIQYIYIEVAHENLRCLRPHRMNLYLLWTHDRVADLLLSVCCFSFLPTRKIFMKRDDSLPGKLHCGGKDRGHERTQSLTLSSVLSDIKSLKFSLKLAGVRAPTDLKFWL